MSKSITNILELIRVLVACLPFLLFVYLNGKKNLEKSVRSRQFLMPLLAIAYCIIIMIFMDKLANLAVSLLNLIPGLFEKIGGFFAGLGLSLTNVIGNFFMAVAEKIRRILAAANPVYLLMIAFNNLGMLAHIFLKGIILPILRSRYSEDRKLASKICDIFYERDGETNLWFVRPGCGQARSYIKVFYYTGVGLSMVAMLVTCGLYKKGLLAVPFYPVFATIVVGEMYFFLNGETKAEYMEDVHGDEEEKKGVLNYAILREKLSALFGDKLAAEDTTVCNESLHTVTTDELLTDIENRKDDAAAAYATFMRTYQKSGATLDQNYLESGLQLLNGQSILFNNPFYYDLIPYGFFAMDRSLLKHGKVLIVCGRHGVEDEAKKWCDEGLRSISHIDELWRIGVLTSDEQDLDVGIITRSDVHNNKLIEANADFLAEVKFVMLLEPSRLIPTAQLGLNILIRACRVKNDKLTFCSCDRNCDGLLDSLSHILMCSLSEVSATKKHGGVCSYMCWTPDSEYLQHRMMPNVARYLGVGTELSFAALKHQVATTSWYGGDAFPVTDMRWIAKQYYYELLHYADLPIVQEEMDRVFTTNADMWSAKPCKSAYMTVEDESCNMFELKRNFASRASQQSFINVISTEYLLRDYMTANDRLFDTDPKAIPCIVADYARTERNVALRSCLKMCTGMLEESDLIRELVIIDVEPGDAAQSLWHLICKTLSPIDGIEEDRRAGEVIRRTIHGKELVFDSKVIQSKRRYSIATGTTQVYYYITDSDFTRFILGELRNAEYVAEDETEEDKYIGSELVSHVFQKYLPGQFFTLSGKYYEMLSVTSDGRILIRRAADHITGRPSYRQKRVYHIGKCKQSEAMGAVKSTGDIRVTKLFADVRVSTDSYWQLNQSNDFETGKLVEVSGIPDRRYNNKSILKIDFPGCGEGLSKEVRGTLTLLINEVGRTLFAENANFISAVTAGEHHKALTYSLEAEEGFAIDENAIYVIEDSQIDIGLLEAFERNIYRILEIICDYLDWHFDALEKSLNPVPEPEPIVFTVPEGEAEPEGKKVPKIFRPFVKFWKFLKKIFQKIKEFFAKLFKKKPRKGADQPEEAPVDGVTEAPEGEATEAPEGEATEVPEGEATEVPEGETSETPEGEAPEGEDAEAPAEEPSEETAEPEEEPEPAEEPAAEPEKVTFDDSDEEEEEEAEGEGEPKLGFFKIDYGFNAFARAAENGEPEEANAGEAEEAPVDADDTSAPADAHIEAGTTIGFEGDGAHKPVVLPTRKPYHERYYLLYGAAELSDQLALTETYDLLKQFGYSGKSLYQARTGKTIAELIEASYNPAKRGAHFCDFCGVELSGAEFDVLSDGRERCPSCGRTAVKTEKEFIDIYKTVLKNMDTFYGVRIKVPVTVRMTSAKKLYKRLGKQFVATSGFDARAIGVAIKDKEGYSLYIENGSPKLNAMMTMAHEITHIWQYTNWDKAQIIRAYGAANELEIYEGMAMWTEIQYAYLIGEAATAKREEIVTRMRQDVYGTGFIKYAAQYPMSYGTHLDGKSPFDDTTKPL